MARAASTSGAIALQRQVTIERGSDLGPNMKQTVVLLFALQVGTTAAAGFGDCKEYLARVDASEVTPGKSHLEKWAREAQLAYARDPSKFNAAQLARSKAEWDAMQALLETSPDKGTKEAKEAAASFADARRCLKI